MNRLLSQAEAMDRYATQQEKHAAEYERMAEATMLPHYAARYRESAARCRSEAAWYREKAQDRRVWAESEPESAAAMFSRLAEILQAEEAA